MEEIEYKIEYIEVEVDIDQERRKRINEIIEKIKDIWLDHAFSFDNEENRNKIVRDVEELLVPKGIGASIKSGNPEFGNHGTDLSFISKLKIEYAGDLYPIDSLINFWFLRWIKVK